MERRTCMHILIADNVILTGPREWSKRVFERVLSEELNVTANLPQEPPGALLLDTAKVLPVVYTSAPDINPRTQILNGPFWAFMDDVAIGTFVPQYKNIDAVKNELKAEVAHNRWVREVSGTSANIQGVNVTLTTERGDRDMFAQALLLQMDGKTWKFPNGVWLTLSLADLQQVVTAISNHISAAFVWEAGVCAVIDAATEITELELVSTEWPQNT